MFRHSLINTLKINTLEGLLFTAHEVKSVSKQTSPLPAWSKAKGGTQVILKASSKAHSQRKGLALFMDTREPL